MQHNPFEAGYKNFTKQVQQTLANLPAQRNTFAETVFSERYFSPATLSAIKNSFDQTSGTYKIIPGDSTLINNAKSIYNLLARLEILIPQLLVPALAHLDADSLWSNISTFFSAAYAAYTSKPLFAIIEADIHNMMYSTQELLAIFHTLPGMDQNLMPLITNLRANIEQGLGPVMQFIQLQSPAPEQNPVRQEQAVVAVAGNPKEESSLHQIQLQVIEVLKKLDNYITDNGINVDNPGPDRREKAAVDLMNALVKFNAALHNLDSLLTYQSLSFFDTIKAFCDAIAEFDKSLQSMQSMMDAELKMLLAKTLRAMAPYLKTMTHHAEVYQIRLGLRDDVLLRTVNEINASYMTLARGYINETNFEFIFLNEKLRARREEALRAEAESREATELFTKFKDTPVNSDTSLYALLALREDAKRAKTAASINFIWGLDQIILGRTGIGELNSKIKELERIIIKTTDAEEINEKSIELKNLYALRAQAEQRLQAIYKSGDTNAKFYVDVGMVAISDVSSPRIIESNFLTPAYRKAMLDSLSALAVTKKSEQERLALLVNHAENSLISKHTGSSENILKLKRDLRDLEINDLVHNAPLDKLHGLYSRLEQMDFVNKEKIEPLLQILSQVLEQRSGLTAMERRLANSQKIVKADSDIRELRGFIVILNSQLKSGNTPDQQQLQRLGELLGQDVKQIQALIQQSQAHSLFDWRDYAIVQAINKKIKEHEIICKPGTDVAARRHVVNTLPEKIVRLRDQLRQGLDLDKLPSETATVSDPEAFERAKSLALKALNESALPAIANTETRAPVLPQPASPDFVTPYNPEESPHKLKERLVNAYKGPIILQSENARATLLRQAATILNPEIVQSLMKEPRLADGSFKINLSDPSLVQNIKALYNLMITFEKLLYLIQEQFDKLVIEGGLKNYLSMEYYGLKPLKAELLLRIGDLNFYLQNLARQIPVAYDEQNTAWNVFSAAIPSLQLVKEWGGKYLFSAADVATGLDNVIRALETPKNKPAERVSGRIYDGILAQLDEILKQRNPDDVGTENLNRLRNSLIFLGEAFHYMKEISQHDSIPDYALLLNTLIDINEELKDLDPAQFTILRKELQAYLQIIHQAMLPMIAQSELFEMQSGLPEGSLKNIIQDASKTFEEIADRAGANILEHSPFYTSTIHVLQIEIRPQEQLVEELVSLRGRILGLAPNDVQKLKEYLPPSKVQQLFQDIQTSGSAGLSVLDELIKAQQDKLKAMKAKVEGYKKQQKVYVNETMRQIRKQVAEMEIALKLPPHSLSDLTRTYDPKKSEEENFQSKANRVDTLTNLRRGLLTLMSQNSSSHMAYETILNQPGDTAQTVNNIYQEAKKHSWTIGRFLRGIIGKPSVSDQIFRVARYLRDPEKAQARKEFLKAQIKLVEEVEGAQSLTSSTAKLTQQGLTTDRTIRDKRDNPPPLSVEPKRPIGLPPKPPRVGRPPEPSSDQGQPRSSLK